MGLWSWLRGVREPDTGDTSAPGLPSGGEPAGRDECGSGVRSGMARASARAADPRRRCALRRPPRRLRREPRHLAEPAHADRAGARAGTVGALGVRRGDRRRDARPARRRRAPGGRGAAVALSTLTTPSLPGSATASVQREVRFDPPAGGRRCRGRCRRRASRVPAGSLPAPLLGAPAPVQRSDGSSTSSGAPGLPPVAAASALPAPESGVGSAAVGVPPAGSSSSGSSSVQLRQRRHRSDRRPVIRAWSDTGSSAPGPRCR